MRYLLLPLLALLAGCAGLEVDTMLGSGKVPRPEPPAPPLDIDEAIGSCSNLGHLPDNAHQAVCDCLAARGMEGTAYHTAKCVLPTGDVTLPVGVSTPPLCPDPPPAQSCPETSCAPCPPPDCQATINHAAAELEDRRKEGEACQDRHDAMQDDLQTIRDGCTVVEGKMGYHLPDKATLACDDAATLLINPLEAN